MTARSHRDPRPAQLPFTRPLDVTTVKDDGLTIAIAAEPQERAAVAADIGLQGLDKLTATFRVQRSDGGCLNVTGELEATIVETCVVSLEPFEREIRQPIALAFAPQASSTIPRGGQRLSVPVAAVAHGSDDMQDPPDPIIGDRIDLGAVAIEFLNLARDPYPKRPEARFQDVVVEERGGAERSPFAVLERLKDRP